MGLALARPDFYQADDVLMSCKGSVVAFTGAGISAESGVPTYRDPGGLWTIYNQRKVSHIGGFLRRPLSCWRFEVELYRILKDCTHNAAHQKLADLEQAGILLGVITQNVDGLHLSAGSSMVVELHGNETRAVCMNENCRQKVSVKEIFKDFGWIDADGNVVDSSLPDDRWIRNMDDDFEETIPNEMAMHMSGVYEDVPKCRSCGCLLKPDAVYFGEGLDEKVLLAAQHLIRRCRCMLIIGSNCSVAPASTLPAQVKKAGGSLVEINPKRSAISDLVDIRIEGSAVEVVPRLADTLMQRGPNAASQHFRDSCKRRRVPDSA